MEGQEALVRAYGAREISSGMLSVSTEKNLGLCSRVGGDAIDIATLLAALRDDNPNKQNVTTALALVAGITLLDFMAAQGATGVIVTSRAIATSIVIAAAFLTVLRLPEARRRNSGCLRTCGLPSQQGPIVQDKRRRVAVSSAHRATADSPRMMQLLRFEYTLLVPPVGVSLSV
jgi:hypothetical protein